MKKFVKIIAYSLGGLLVFVLLLAAFTQTQLFRDYLRSTAMSSLDSLLDAEIQLGEIQGNLVEGFSIDHLSIKVRKDYLLVADRLDLRYDLFQIPGNVISVDRITLVRPSVKFLRGRDGVWNLDRMLRPTPEDTMVGGRFDWTILVTGLRFKMEPSRLWIRLLLPARIIRCQTRTM